jgi:hypothetical protein
MNNEKSMNEAVMALFKVQSRYLPGDTEENYENSG